MCDNDFGKTYHAYPKKEKKSLFRCKKKEKWGGTFDGGTFALSPLGFQIVCCWRKAGGGDATKQNNK